MVEAKIENMKTKKGDFIELDFNAYANGVLVDTTREEEAKKAGAEIDKTDRNKKFKPLVLCIGEEMVLKSFDKALEDKEIGKEYEIKLKPEEAFGKRSFQLVKTLPISAFQETPYAGMFVNVNGIVAKVISINSGRVVLDFNHPLAGKEITYKFKINTIIKDKEKKIAVLAKNFAIEFQQFDPKENKIVIKNLENIDKSIVEQFKKKVKELVGIDIKIENKDKRE